MARQEIKRVEERKTQLKLPVSFHIFPVPLDASEELCRVSNGRMNRHGKDIEPTNVTLNYIIAMQLVGTTNRGTTSNRNPSTMNNLQISLN